MIDMINMTETSSTVQRARNSMDHLFEEISAKVNDLLIEQGCTVGGPGGPGGPQRCRWCGRCAPLLLSEVLVVLILCHGKVG